MRLLTYRDAQGMHLGALREDGVVPLDPIAADMLSFIDGGPSLLEQARAFVAYASDVRPLDQQEVLAPIPRPRQHVICVGMNYAAHAIETHRARGREPTLPSYPVFFTKATHTVCGPETPIPRDPRVTQQLDYEAELAVIIGRAGKNIARADAFHYIFGYTIVNDISARDLQAQHQQFFKGKSLDHTCPMGPWIVTADEIPHPEALHIQLRLNGVLRQDAPVSAMIFPIPTLIEHLSLGMTIDAGTIIATGTPSGVGLGRTPPAFLQPGDLIEIAIAQIGTLRNRVVAS